MAGGGEGVTESVRRRKIRHLVAEWLVDSYGQDGDTTEDFIDDATDFVKYLTAHGWEITGLRNETRKQIENHAAYRQQKAMDEEVGA